MHLSPVPSEATPGLKASEVPTSLTEVWLLSARQSLTVSAQLRSLPPAVIVTY